METRLKRFLSLALALLMVFSMMPQITLGASAANLTGGEKLYLTPNSNWKKDNARFAIYVFGNGEAWASMTKVAGETDLYEVTVPSGNWTNVIFCRMSPSATANNWNNRWNQTADLTWDGSNNHYTVKAGTWDKGGGTWSVYAPETVEPETTIPETTVPETTTPETEAPVVEKVTVYCINSAKWAAVSAYAWNASGNNSWPGVAMTKTGDTVNGFDVYSVAVDKTYTSIIFNNSSNGFQTADLTLEAGKYYDVKSDTWYASLNKIPAVDPLATDASLPGSFNAWNATNSQFKLTAAGATTATVTLTLEANKTYEFKVVNNGSWLSTSTAIKDNVSGLKLSPSVSGDAKITTKDAGEYVFTYNLSANTLAVAYPAAEPEETEPEAPAAISVENTNGTLLNMFCSDNEQHVAKFGFNPAYCTVSGSGYDANDGFWTEVTVNVEAWAAAVVVDEASALYNHVASESNPKTFITTYWWANDAWVPSGYQDVQFTCPVAPKGTIQEGRVNVDDEARTFLTIESWIEYANESIVVKVFDANGTLLATTSLVDNDRVLLGKENFSLSTFIGINCTDSWWNTKWEEGKLRADFVPAKATLIVDSVEMNTSNILMRGATSNDEIDWATVPGVNPAPHVATTYEVATKADLDAALAAAQDGDTIKLTADINCGSAALKIENAITLDLGGKTLTTSGRNYSLSLHNDGIIVTNGKLVHAGTVAAIKVWNAAEISNLEIDVTGTSSSGYAIGGIVIQQNAAGVDTIKNVKIYSTAGQGIANGIETNNCGNATEPVIGSMENVTIDAVGTALNISAPCGTATGCSFSGGKSGIEIWIKGTYSATLELVDCDVTGGEQAVYAHDEFSSADIENNGELTLSADNATTFVATSGAPLTLTIARAENVDETVINKLIDTTVAKVGDTYYVSVANALAAANEDGTSTVTVLKDTDEVAEFPVGTTLIIPEGVNAPNVTVAERIPEGRDFTGYTGADAIWGETWGNAKESFVIKVLDADGNVMGTTSLNNVGGIIDGDVEVTWNLKLDAASNTDEYWTMEWTTAPTIDNQPAKVELWVDGVKVSGGNVVLNGPDDLNKIYAAEVDADGKITEYCNLDTFVSKIGDLVDRRIVVLRDVSFSSDKIRCVEFISGIEGGVTVTNTDVENWIDFDFVTIGKGVTVNVELPFSGDSENVIEGTLNAGDTYYHGYDAKTTIQNGGNVHVGGTTILRYNENADAGIYVYGDGDDSTVEFDCDYYIGAYSGTFYAENANIETGYFLLKNSYDNSSYADIDMTLDGSSLTVVGTTDTQDSFIIDDQASLTLKNGSAIKDVRDFNILAGTNLTLSVDESSSISATYVNVAEGVGLEATKNEDGTVTFKKILKGTGTEEDPILINDLADLILFRDTVNTYTQDGSNQFKGKYVKLTADIDLAGINWEPIGTNSVGDHSAFLGIFDGAEHTISNLYVNSDGDHLGFFARVGSYAEGITPTVKNLKFHNVDVSSNTLNSHGGSYVGGVIANAGGNSVVSNITVTGDVKVVGYGYVGGIVGHGYPDLTNCHVKANDGSYLKCYYWCAGGIIGYAGERGTPIVNCSVSGLDIWSAYGAAAAVAGLLQDGNKLENVSASNVEITSNSDYCMGYIAGNGECSTLTNVKIENVTATANGKPITATDAVAYIGETPYFSLQDAAEAVKSGETITLICDVILTETVFLPDGVTLKSNGNTINGSIRMLGSLHLDGPLTITGGLWVGKGGETLTATLSGDKLTATYFMFQHGTYTINADIDAVYGYLSYNGIFEVNSTIHTTGTNGEVLYINGNVTLNDGAVLDSDNSVFLSNDGAFLSLMSGSKVDSNVKLTAAGTLESSGDITGTIEKANVDAEIIIYAGTYTQDVTEWCELGYTAKDNGDGTWTVKAAVEAKIGKKSYATLAEAFAAAKEGDTILLQADAIVDKVLTVNHNITLADYDTYTVKFIGDGAIHITGSNNLNLENVILTAPVYADSNTAGATIGNAVAITGVEAIKSTVVSDGETVTVTNPKWVADVNGTVYYLTIDEAIKGAVADDTVNIYAGEYTQNLSVNKGITVVGETDAEGNNLVNFTGKLNITADGAAVKNINFNNGGSTAGYISAKDVLVEGCSVVGGNGFRYCYTSGTVTFKDSTITGSTYGIHFDGSAGGNIVIDNCVITGWTSFAGTIEKVSMKDTTFAEGNYNYVRFYQDEVVMEDCTFNDNMKVDIAVSGATVNVTNPTFNGEIENLFNASDIDASDIYVDGTRLITPEASINGVEYDTFAEAIAAIGDGDVVIELITDVTLDYGAREAYGTDATTSVTINGNGKTVTLNQKDSDWSSIGLKNNAKLVLNNMTVEKTGYGDTSGAWNTHAIQFTCPVEMTDVVINNAIAVEAGATLNNVTINEANGYYGLWIVGNGQTVTVNGGAINATNGGRGIKIADQYVDSAKQVTLNVTGTKFTTAKKAAVLVSSTDGAKITANGADISGVAEDTVNFAWVDEDWAATSSTVTVNGEPAALESAEEFIVTATSNGVLGHYKTLEAAAAAADEGTEVTILTAGTYKVPTGKNLTITGAVDGVVFDNIGACGMGGASVTFNNVTFDYLPNTNYTGLQHSGNMVYNNCTINGQVFLYGQSETFNKCTFNQTSADAYNVWTYGAKEVAFNECTFNSAGKSVLIYAEGASIFNDVTVTDCDFIASAPVDGKAAIEMDSSLTSGINLTIDGETTATGFGTGNVSGNSLWNNKKDNKVEANNDITVIVNNETVLEPLTLVAQVGSVKYINIEDAIAAVENAGTIELLTDVEISETLYVNSNSAFDKITITINGNGHTIKAVGEGWTNGMHMVEIAWNVVLNDVTFDGNNTGCRGVQFYTSSSTLNNVTVKNISADLWSWTDYAIHANASDLTVTGTLTFENCKYGNLHLDIGSKLPEGTVSVVDTASATLKGAKIVLEGANTSATAKRLHVRYAAAELNGTYYGVLADAIALAQVDDQLVLMADAEKIELTKSINLDVNGKTVGEFVLTAADVILTAEEGLNVTTAVEDHKVVYANGVYSVERKPNADITYGIYDVETTGEAGTESYRERMAVDLYNVYAKESLVVELWSGETKLSTTTLRESDRDDATVKFYPYSGDITANIVIAGRLAGSWDTEWLVAPSVYSLPDSIKVYADGELVATWNGGFMNEEEAENFGELPGVEKPFKLAGANVLLGDSLKMFFYVNYADLEGEDYYAEIRRTYNDGTADEVIKVPYSQWENYNSKMIRIGYNGLSAKAMSDEVYVTIYNGEDVAVSQAWEDSIKAYAMRQLSNTSSAKLKTVLVDLLNYGAAAQAEFGNYGINDLANADLTAEQKAYATQSVTLVDNRVMGTNYAGSSISLKSSIVLTMYFQNLTSELYANPSVDDLYAVVTYTDHNDNPEELRVEGEDFIVRGSMHGVDITGLAVADGKQLVTCVVYDADGNEIARAADSIESYIARMANDADPIYEMAMKFVTSAIAYFG